MTLSHRTCTYRWAWQPLLEHSSGIICKYNLYTLPSTKRAPSQNTEYDDDDQFVTLPTTLVIHTWPEHLLFPSQLLHLRSFTTSHPLPSEPPLLMTDPRNRSLSIRWKPQRSFPWWDRRWNQISRHWRQSFSYTKLHYTSTATAYTL